MDVDPVGSNPGSVEQASPSQIADTSDKRFKCPDCDKSYRAKETLNRHRKNHSRQAEHVCSICHVGFRRKDLLLRHSKIHRSDDSSIGPRERQRIRQACDRCSKLKTKCDAQSPCSSCVRGDHQCTYGGRKLLRAKNKSMEFTSQVLSPLQAIAPRGPASNQTVQGLTPPTDMNVNLQGMSSSFWQDDRHSCCCLTRCTWRVHF